MTWSVVLVEASGLKKAPRSTYSIKQEIQAALHHFARRPLTEQIVIVLKHTRIDSGASEDEEGTDQPNR